jgi:hypothetical protein
MKLTVADLIRELSKYPDEAVVILAEDSEGNDFHLLSNLTSEDRFQDYGYGIELIDPVEPRYTSAEPNIFTPVILWP